MANDVAIGNAPPGIEIGNTRKHPVYRMPTNPLDRATIVSIFPMVIDENKPTIFPSRFFLDKGSIENPTILVVGPSSWFYEPPNDAPTIEVPNSAVQIADSVVQDYCNGLLGCDMGDRRPGLFFIPGEKTLKEVKTSYAVALSQAQVRQRAWFAELVKLGDGLWARSNQNPVVIWDLMRIAARDLGLNKPWLADSLAIEKVKCFACGNLKDPQFPICPNCRTIDQDHPRAKDIKIATQ